MGERGENVENHLGEELKHEKSFRGRIKTTYLKKNLHVSSQVVQYVGN